MLSSPLSLFSLIEAQCEFQTQYVLRTRGKALADLTDDERERLVIEQLLALVGEVHELLNVATNWKSHRAKRAIDWSAVLTEHVDIGKYWLNLFIYLNIGLDEFMVAFNAKSRLVRQRLAIEFPAADSVVEPLSGGD